MKNKDISNILTQLRKHTPLWTDIIRRYINKLEKQPSNIFKEIEFINRPLAGDFGETPIFKEYQKIKKKYLQGKE